MRSSIVQGKERQEKQKTPAEGAEREGGRARCLSYFCKEAPSPRVARSLMRYSDSCVFSCRVYRCDLSQESAMLMADAQNQKYTWLMGMEDLMSVETPKLVCLMKALLYTSNVFSALWSRAGIPAGKTTSHQLNMFRLLCFFFKWESTNNTYFQNQLVDSLFLSET